MVSDLSVTWISGQGAGHRILSRETDAEHRHNLIGPLNANSPNRVQILGSAEIRLISENQPDNAHQHPNHFMQTTFGFLQNDTELIVITDGQTPPPTLLSLAAKQGIPIFSKMQ